MIALFGQESRSAEAWRFTDVTESSGLTTNAPAERDDGARPRPTTLEERIAGGVAVADYDQDGDVDVYVTAQRGENNRLFENRRLFRKDGDVVEGSGGFREVGARAGAALESDVATGPLFFDFDGDGWLDLFVGSVSSVAPTLLRNQGDGTFEDVSLEIGPEVANAVSASAGDFDGDGWLDLFLTHWGAPPNDCYLWRNREGRGFECLDEELGILPIVAEGLDATFAANFVDIQGDGWLDILVTADFGQTRLLLNRGGTRIDVYKGPELSDENGMGPAVGDFDGDGDFDWFVSSIFDDDGVTEGNWGTTGNRLYENRGDGTFLDVTDMAAVREGDWGWGSCFGDFNQDGWLDVAHVNGWPQGSAQFRDTNARLFLGSAAGSFIETAQSLGFDDRGDARGLSCADYDGDADLDLFVAHRDGTLRLFRNDAPKGRALVVELAGPWPNIEAIGAKVSLSTQAHTQVRPIQAGSSYVSQSPSVAHFGLGDTAEAARVVVHWPDGSTSSVTNSHSERITIQRSAPTLSGGCNSMFAH